MKKTSFRNSYLSCASFPRNGREYQQIVLGTITRLPSLTFPLPSTTISRCRLTLTAIVSIVSGSIVAIITAGVYIPSAIHTVLEFRCGVIPSLKDPKFLNYREGLVNQTYMIGAMFWGLIVTTLMVTILIALIVFLLVWPASRDIVINLFAQVLGKIRTTDFTWFAQCQHTI
jgi:hypothetical protein